LTAKHGLEAIRGQRVVADWFAIIAVLHGEPFSVHFTDALPERGAFAIMHVMSICERLDAGRRDRPSLHANLAIRAQLPKGFKPLLSAR